MKSNIYESIAYLNFKELKLAEDLVRDRELDTNFTKDKDYIKLKLSIIKVGILNPLILSRKEDGSLELISGRRRLNILKEIINDDDTNIPVKIIKKEYSYLRYEICYSDNQDRKKIDILAQAESLLVDLTIQIVGFETYSQMVRKSLFQAFITQYKTIEIIKIIYNQIKNKNFQIQETEVDNTKKHNIYLIQKRLDELSKNLNIEKRQLLLMLLKNLTPSEKILISRGFDSSILYKFRKNKIFKVKFQNFEIIVYNIYFKNIDEINRVLTILRGDGLLDYADVIEKNINDYFDDGGNKTDIYKQILSNDFKNEIIDSYKNLLVQECENINEYNNQQSTIKDLKKKINKIFKSDSQELIEKLNIFINSLERD